MNVDLAPPKPYLRGMFHAAAAISAITLAPIIITATPGGAPRAAVSVYAAAVIGLFLVSALYHTITWSPGVRAVWRKLDHSMIFVAIAATYTPIAVICLDGRTARHLLAIVWAGAIAGIASKFLIRRGSSLITAVPYVVVGWAAVFYVDELWHRLGVAGFTLVLTGGLVFTLGAIIYALRRPDPCPRWFGYHELFHLFVIAGVVLHYVAVAFVAIPQAA